MYLEALFEAEEPDLYGEPKFGELVTTRADFRDESIRRVFKVVGFFEADTKSGYRVKLAKIDWRDADKVETVPGNFPWEKFMSMDEKILKWLGLDNWSEKKAIVAMLRPMVKMRSSRAPLILWRLEKKFPMHAAWFRREVGFR